MSFIQDPRVRQRWNQISHNAEAVTENAAAGIWTFQHRYIHPCLAGLADTIDSCTSICIGDREERARRARERDRGARRTRAEYTFDFYDDWDDPDDEGPSTTTPGGGGGGSGILGGWGGGVRSEDWDRLLAGTGSNRGRHHQGGGEGVVDQPRRKRGMSYGTRGTPGGRQKAAREEDDPNVIPRTAPLGFLGRLPFKIGGTLRYKPSAANLQDHPGAGGGSAQEQEQEHGRMGEYGEANENQPLLGVGGGGDDDDYGFPRQQQQQQQRRGKSPLPPPPQQGGSRPRSNTTGSGETSSSYRSRGDLFPSDGEGEEDAVPLDDEFAVALDRVDDRSSNRTRSSKGKRPAAVGGGDHRSMSRTISRTTIDSTYTIESMNGGSADPATVSFSVLGGDVAVVGTPELVSMPSLEDLRREEEEAEREEHEEIERRRRAASQLAVQKGLRKEDDGDASIGDNTTGDQRDEDITTTTTIYDETKDEISPPALTTIIPPPELEPEPEAGLDKSSERDLQDAERRESLPGYDEGGSREAKSLKNDASKFISDTELSLPGGQANEFVPARLPFFR